jgi:hypothetical protein
MSENQYAQASYRWIGSPLVWSDPFGLAGPARHGLARKHGLGVNDSTFATAWLIAGTSSQTERLLDTSRHGLGAQR